MHTMRTTRRGVVSAGAMMLATMLSANGLQGPPQSGPPGNSNRRSVDPREQAVKPPGPALGLHAQCEPLGGVGVGKGDFNGDDIGDLAVGVPFEDIGSVRDAGAVNVIYGSANGLVSTGNQFLHQGSNTAGTAEQDDHFGWAVASGDFNGDGFSDLAVGVPDEDFEGFNNPGQVYIFQGSANGLTFQRFVDYRDFSGVLLAHDDQFGYSLVWADFNGDTVGDLAIGVPNRNVQYRILTTCGGGFPPEPCTRVLEVVDAGTVVTLYGRPGGLTTTGAQEVRQGDPVAAFRGNPWFGGNANSTAGFGLTLTAGDYDGDGFDDLAIGVPFAACLTIDVLACGVYAVAAGQVHVIFGSADRLRRDRFVLLDQDSRDGTPEEYDRFGSALASGDFNSDGHDDLAVGVPYEDAEAGIVQVFFGAAGGFDSLEQTFSQSVFTLFDGRQKGDLFGHSLAAGDFNGDGRKDLAIGVPGEDIGAIDNVGIVQVVYGGNGLSTCCVGPAPQVWQQLVSNISGSAATGDQFGFSLSAWNFGRSSHADLAVGVPFDDVFDTHGNDAGSVQIIYGSASGLVTTGRQVWTQTNLTGSASEAGDQFGRAVY